MKEQARTARALAKREARQARRDSRAAGVKPDEGFDEETSAQPTEQEPGADETPTE